MLRAALVAAALSNALERSFAQALRVNPDPN
jgi:hypothetical protein